MLRAGFIKFHQLFQTLLVIGGRTGGGGEAALVLRLLFCKIVCNVLCLSFLVVLYSTYSLCAVIKMVLLDERDCDV